MRILVGMSGGVDSTFAAHRLIEEGHEVAGALLEMHSYTDTAAAKLAAASLEIPLYIINCREAFEHSVVSNFISEYRRGRTPNPCIICNSEVKLECLLDYALANGYDAIATGHYARVGSVGRGGEIRYFLSNARDGNKDQTYMLWRISQRVLAHLVLPLSELTKEEIRAETARIGLVSWDRADSQEICFIPDNDHASFIESRVGASDEGNFINNEGKVLGRHRGIVNYTVGQRKGLGIALGSRAFISKIDPETNSITISDKPSTSYFFTVSGVVFSGISAPLERCEYRLTVKHRYAAPRTPATVIFYPDGRAEVRLDEPVRSVTPGQSAVFYDGDRLAAGGFID